MWLSKTGLDILRAKDIVGIVSKNGGHLPVLQWGTKHLNWLHNLL